MFGKEIYMAQIVEWKKVILKEKLLLNLFPNKPWFLRVCKSYKPYKSFENTVGKGEIACNKQFLFFPLCVLSVLRTFFHFDQM